MGGNERWIRQGLDILQARFGQGPVTRAVQAVKRFEVEVPSWVFGRFGGGRFGGYVPPAPARTIEEKLDDAAFCHRLTGAVPRVATHVLWDFSSDGREPDLSLARKVADAAEKRGISLGAVNPTYFLEGSHRGSFSCPEESVRKRYLEQTVFAGMVAKRYGTGLVTLWFPDGSLYPGQIELGEVYLRMRETLAQTCRSLPKGVRVLIEYKFFEPGTYSTTVPDWGTACLLARSAGAGAGVLIDLGHHPHGTNIEQIVAMLIAEGIPGGFHFNWRYAADDDQAVEPEPAITRIFYELVSGGALGNRNAGRDWPLMIDQCSGRERRIEGILHSVDSLQISLARACLVDRVRLRRHQAKDDVILSHRVFYEAVVHADVRPIVAAARVEKGLDPDIFRALAESRYQERIEKSR